MIRCVRLWSGPDGNSHFEEGAIDLESGPRGDNSERQVTWRRLERQNGDDDDLL